MGSLLVALHNGASALQVFQRQLNVIQNNVTNADTPGYAKQTQTIDSVAFNPELGFNGGVFAGATLSSRSEYSEQAVRSQQQSLGESQQKAADLGQVEPLFDISSNSGLSNQLSAFFQSFSQLSVTPNDGAARQGVIDAATNVASSFNQLSGGLASVSAGLSQQTKSSVTSINQLAGDIANINKLRQQNFQTIGDPGLDAKLHNDLEQLSELTGVTALPQSDGTVSVYLGGQSPLVLGANSYALQADQSGSQTRIVDWQNKDVTNQVQQGNLGALIDEKNNILPSYQNKVDTLAAGFADQVNTTLGAGLNSAGSAPSADLFTYDPTAGAAATLSVTNGFTPDQVAAAVPGAPGGNGNALTLAALANAPQSNGLTFTQNYGNLAGRVGQDLATARDNQSSQQSLVTQARSLRSQASGVSLDEEAAHLLEVQQAYQAAGKLISVLNSLGDTLLGIIR